MPKHIILGSEEVANLVKRFNITINQLPKISVKDPCAKALGAKTGDIIKILRKSETAGISEFYRLVISEE